MKTIFFEVRTQKNIEEIYIEFINIMGELSILSTPHYFPQSVGKLPKEPPMINSIEELKTWTAGRQGAVL